MAVSKYEYVRAFEDASVLLPDCLYILRIDGCRFSEFTQLHRFEKPSDHRGLHLMTCAALHVMKELGEIVLAYGHSDEYRKMLSTVVSMFTSAYIMNWHSFFPATSMPLKSSPYFDGKLLCLPTDEAATDYFRWRQIDCHINTQYNTCFWNLVKHGGYTKNAAYDFLRGTQAAEKNELLFTSFNINYSHLPVIERKGTTIIRSFSSSSSSLSPCLSPDEEGALADKNTNPGESWCSMERREEEEEERERGTGVTILVQEHRGEAGPTEYEVCTERILNGEKREWSEAADEIACDKNEKRDLFTRTSSSAVSVEGDALEIAKKDREEEERRKSPKEEDEATNSQSAGSRGSREMNKKTREKKDSTGVYGEVDVRMFFNTFPSKRIFLRVLHADLINEDFWKYHTSVLAPSGTCLSLQKSKPSKTGKRQLS